MTSNADDSAKGLNEDLYGRLFNYKFEQAVRYLRDDHSTFVRDTVTALAAAFENPGWFGGSLGTVVDAALRAVIAELKADSEWTANPEPEPPGRAGEL